MDINLHSFILVMGLLVIGFIIFDGIKKIRDNKKNELSIFDEQEDALPPLTDDDLEHLHQQGFDELEIADDLVDGFTNDYVEKLDDVVPDELMSSHQSHQSNDNQNPSEETIESFSALDGDMSDAGSEVLAEDDLLPYVDDVEIPVRELEKDSKDITPEAAAEPGVSQDHFTFKLSDEPSEQLNSDPEQTPKVKKQRASVEETAKRKAQLEKEERESALKETGEVSQSTEPLELSPEDSVPVLMEPVELGEKVDPNPPVQHELHLPEFVQQTLNEEPVPKGQSKESLADEQLQDYINLNLEEANLDADDPLLQINEEVGERLAEREVAQEVFVIHVLNENGLNGSDLRNVFTACDMRFGEMNIFHRFEKANAQGRIQFSVANALEPGSFDLANMGSLTTTGISLFMSLPGPENAMEAFDAMAEVALVFARNFNASLCDDSHSDLTPQTLEHYRQRIREFSRKRYTTASH